MFDALNVAVVVIAGIFPVVGSRGGTRAIGPMTFHVCFLQSSSAGLFPRLVVPCGGYQQLIPVYTNPKICQVPIPPISAFGALIGGIHLIFQRFLKQKSQLVADFGKRGADLARL